MSKIVTKELVYQHLRTVLDPELGVDIVSLGLVYDVSIATQQVQTGESYQIHILLTLTTPGCPLAPTIEDMIRQSLDGVEGLDAYRQLSLEITFDPPWTPEMMDPETRAQLGVD